MSDHSLRDLTIVLSTVSVFFEALTLIIFVLITGCLTPKRDWQYLPYRIETRSGCAMQGRSLADCIDGRSLAAMPEPWLWYAVKNSMNNLCRGLSDFARLTV